MKKSGMGWVKGSGWGGWVCEYESEQLGQRGRRNGERDCSCCIGKLTFGAPRQEVLEMLVGPRVDRDFVSEGGSARLSGTIRQVARI